MIMKDLSTGYYNDMYRSSSTGKKVANSKMISVTTLMKGLMTVYNTIWIYMYVYVHSVSTGQLKG